MQATTTDPKATAADGKQPIVYTADHPEYPKVLYNSKNRTTVSAKDKDDEDKLKGKGYTEDPYPPLPPDAMTTQDMQELESLLHKLLKSLAKYSTAQTNSGSADAQTVPGAAAYPGATGATGEAASGAATASGTTTAAHSGATDWTKPPAKK